MNDSDAKRLLEREVVVEQLHRAGRKRRPAEHGHPRPVLEPSRHHQVPEPVPIAARAPPWKFGSSIPKKLATIPKPFPL